MGIPISHQECMVRLSFLYLTSVINRLGVLRLLLRALALRVPLIWLVYTRWQDNLYRIGTIAPLVSGFMAFYTSIYVSYGFWKERNRRIGFQNRLRGIY